MLWPYCYIIVLSLINEYQVSALPSEATGSPINFTVDVTYPNNPQSDCCINESTCKFNSLYNALKCVRSHTVVTILSSKVMLTSPVSKVSCNNVTIVGLTHATVSCKNESYVQFDKSDNVVVENITWENCGLNDSLLSYGQLNFYDCSNIIITNSIFQNSSSTGIVFISVYGNIIVQYSIFRFNIANGQAGGMLVSTDTGTGRVNPHIHLVINMTNFYSNDALCPDDLQCSGGLYINIPDDSVNEAYLQIESSKFTFHNASGSGAIFIIVSVTGKLSIVFIDVLFSNNFGKLAGALYLDAEIPNSSISSNAHFNFTSTKFTQNGGIVVRFYVNRNVQMSISNVTFSNNFPAGLPFEASNIILELEKNYTTHLHVFNSTFQENSINIFTISACQNVVARFSNISVVNNTGQGGITVRNGELCKDASSTVWWSWAPGEDHGIEFVDSEFTNNTEHLGVIYINGMAERINITNCNFIGNYADDGVVVMDNTQDVTVQFSTFSDNHASGLYVLHGDITLVDHIVFQKNTANSGGGIALMKGSTVILKDAHLEFVDNFAVHYGGAIYAEVPYCYSVVVISDSKSMISFVNNSATIAGDSAYFLIPSSCKVTSKNFYKFLSSLRGLQCNNIFADNSFSCYEYMRSSPMDIISNDVSNCNGNSVECFFNIGVMLGEEMTIPLKVIDYFNQTAEPTVFLVSSNTNGYRLESSSTKYTIISNGFSGVSIVGNDPGSSIRNVTIDLSTVEVSDTNHITLHLNVSLKGCHAGFVYNKNLSKCVCFTKYGIVQCINSARTMITRGYWFGYVIFKGKKVASLSICPNNYCTFVECSSDKNNMCVLHSNLQQQCHAHRIGVVCSECESSYTLSYDSTVCISNKQCTAGHIVLVVILTIIYWIAIVVVVFLVLSFNLKLSYLFSIIYFYSIVDVLVGSNLYISDGVFQTVTLLSSFAKLSPQFLGKMCLFEGMSGIDQLFIHYIHPLAILVILIGITVVARNSLKVSSFISPIIIRVICLLLLLSYTSITSTSLSLLRNLKFTDIDRVYTYLSPEIEYFHGRHGLYGGVAVLCELIIGIGLPLLLIFDPYISRKINLTRLRPLLDQFQGGYKDKYRWCAAYYLICRQVIFLFVYLTSISNHEQMNFILLVVCAVVAMFHAWIQPYAKEGLNSLDEVILVSLIVIVGLNGTAFSSEILAKMIVGFVFFPLFCFIGFIILYSRIKGKIVHTFVYVKHVLCCGALHHIMQDDGALDDYDQYDRSTDSHDESQPLIPSSNSGSILRYS